MNVLSLHNKSNFRFPSSKLEEKYLFQEAIEEIMIDFIDLYTSERSTENLLACIYKHTRNPAFFSPSSRLISLAKLSNYLLQVASHMNKAQLFPICQNNTVFIPELNIHLVVQLEIGEWREDSFVIKKFVWDEHNQELMNHLISLYCYKAYIEGPKKIEIIDLCNGEIYTSPISDYHEAIQYLKQLQQDTGLRTIDGTFYMINVKKQ